LLDKSEYRQGFEKDKIQTIFQVRRMFDVFIDQWESLGQFGTIS